MESLAKIEQYIENGKDHEKCNFSNLLFENLDYRNIEHPISFFRSDFSRSKFENCLFNRNNFGRADFIDVNITKSKFVSVDFGSCLVKNAFIEDVIFTKNNYHGVAMQYSYFKKCIFENEHFITNMFHCDFYECKFINCTFTKSSLDCNSFTSCEFSMVDMSECITENSKYNNCILQDVFLCANLWTTHLYKDTDIRNFGFKYRGEIVDLWNGDYLNFISNLLHKKQYFEYLNTIIISGNTHSNRLIEEFKTVFPKIMALPLQTRKSTIVKILDMLYFYYGYYQISFDDYLSIYYYLINYNWNSLSFDENVIYQSKLYQINQVINHFDFSLAYLKTLSPSSICISKIHINTNDENTAISYLKNIFQIANRDVCNNMFNEPLFKVVKKEKGSIILTIVSATLLVLLISYVAKNVMHNVFSIQIESGIKKALLKQLSDSKIELSDIKDSCGLAKKYCFLTTDDDKKSIEKLSSELTKGEIIDIIINLLF